MARLSITRRIVLLVLMGSILILIALGILSRSFFENIIGSELRLGVMQNIQRVVGDGRPISLYRVQELAPTLDYPVGYAGPEGVWQSDESMHGWQEVPLRPIFGGRGPYKEWDDDDDKGKHGKPPRPQFPMERGWFNDQMIFVFRQGPSRIALLIDTENNPGQFWRYILLAIFLVAVITTVIIFGVRRITRPIKELTMTVQAIGQGDFDKRVNWTRNDELGDLGRSVDDMACKISSMLEAKRDLLLAIGHELKTPLTRAKLTASLKNDGAISEELDEINLVLDQLLESERMAEGHQTLNISHFNLSQLLKALMQQLGGRWDDEVDDNLVIDGDERRLGVALGNILKNARAYGGGEPILVAAHRQGSDVVINITDRGPGVSECDLSKLTEPFFRLDESRNRESGGLGLGLYLTARIIRAHHGNLVFSNVQSNSVDEQGFAGLNVRIVMPMTLAS